MLLLFHNHQTLGWVLHHYTSITLDGKKIIEKSGGIAADTRAFFMLLKAYSSSSVYCMSWGFFLPFKIALIGLIRPDKLSINLRYQEHKPRNPFTSVLVWGRGLFKMTEILCRSEPISSLSITNPKYLSIVWKNLQISKLTVKFAYFKMFLISVNKCTCA